MSARLTSICTDLWKCPGTGDEPVALHSQASEPVARALRRLRRSPRSPTLEVLHSPRRAMAEEEKARLGVQNAERLPPTLDQARKNFAGDKGLWSGLC